MIRRVSINVSNLASSNHLELLMAGLSNNDGIIKLDFSDNELTDAEGVFLIQYMKKQSDNRDNALWMNGLRHELKDTRSLSGINNDKYLLKMLMQENSPFMV